MVFLRVSKRVDLLKADQTLCNMPNILCLISVLSLKIELALKSQIHFQSIQNEQLIEKESEFRVQEVIMCRAGKYDHILCI